MDRGIPTERILEQMRAATPPVQYCGEHAARAPESIRAKAGRDCPGRWRGRGVSQMLAEEKELYVLSESKDRVNKERAMRRRN